MSDDETSSSAPVSFSIDTILSRDNENSKDMTKNQVWENQDTDLLRRAYLGYLPVVNPDVQLMTFGGQVNRTLMDPAMLSHLQAWYQLSQAGHLSCEFNIIDSFG